MKIFGIKFESLSTPPMRHVETISATIAFVLYTGLYGIGSFLTIWTLFFTQFRIFAVLYILWLWIDRHTPERGGRTIEWVRNWRLFKYTCDYYPISLHVAPDVELDPKRNYVFGGFPHAIFPSGIVTALATNALGVRKIFPQHTIYPATLITNLEAPIYREYLMALSMISVSAKSLNYVLQNSDGGTIVLIVIGGAAEALLSQSGVYEIVLKNRKGFVKLAIQHGCPLVPVYGFGESDTFKTYIQPRNSLLARLQEYVKNATTVAFPVFHGRGVFQDFFGLAPHRSPINVVVGRPVEVQKNSNPTKEEIDTIHNLFMEAMTNLFEEYKWHFITDAENKKLSIVYSVFSLLNLTPG